MPAPQPTRPRAFFDRLRAHFRRRRRVPMWYAPAYRLPIPSIEALSGSEPRRADLVSWYLIQERLARSSDVRTPRRADYTALSRVHDSSYLESLFQPETLARIFAVSPGEIVVDEVLHTLRLAVGGTLAAARAARASGGPAFNLFGGFHHAGPAMGGGMCALNDVAVAIADLRVDGFDGQVVVLDLDAHPPDGLAACLIEDPRAMIGSISGSDWGPLPGPVDETFLPGADDATYLAALEGLLARLPRPHLAFVLAGGDVLAGDRLGKLGLSLEGARARDLAVAEWLTDVPSVWLPAGGYSEVSWKVVVGSYLAVSRHSRRPVQERDPMLHRFATIARRLDPERLSGGPPQDDWSLADVEAELFHHPSAEVRLLGFYTAEGIEYAITRLGLADHVRRLGYRDLRIQIDPPDEVGQRLTATGEADGRRHVLIDLILSRDTVAGEPALLVHWLSLRNPRAAFAGDRRPLPGQEVPGLGIARDMGQLLGRMAHRLGLALVALRPAYLHTAYAARAAFHFLDPARQLRFTALLHDLGARPLGELTHALAEGRILVDGAPYAWEPDLMIYRPGEPPPDLSVDDNQPRPHFTIAARPGAQLLEVLPTRAK